MEAALQTSPHSDEDLMQKRAEIDGSVAIEVGVDGEVIREDPPPSPEILLRTKMDQEDEIVSDEEDFLEDEKEDRPRGSATATKPADKDQATAESAQAKTS